MTRKAVVAAVNGDMIDLLSLDETEKAHDDVCGGDGSCRPGGCGCRVSGRPFKARVRNGLNVRAGDTVEVSASAVRAAAASAAVLGLPIAAGTAGWLLAGVIAPAATDSLRLAATVGALIVSFGVVLLIGGRRRERAFPEITAVLE